MSYSRNMIKANDASDNHQNIDKSTSYVIHKRKPKYINLEMTKIIHRNANGN